MRKRTQPRSSHQSVLIVRNQGMFSTNLTDLLRHARSLRFDDRIGDRQIVQTIIRLQPDLVLLDMPKAKTRWIRLIKSAKAACAEIRILAVCGENNAGSANRVLRAGADGYITSQEYDCDLSDAIRDVLAGGLYVSECVLTATATVRRSSAGVRPVSRRANSTVNARYARRCAPSKAGTPAVTSL